MTKLGYKRGPDYDLEDPEGIAEDVQNVIDSPSLKHAALVIGWWRCWDEGLSATRFARLMRKLNGIKANE
jgi:hypothetical protein